MSSEEQSILTPIILLGSICAATTCCWGIKGCTERSKEYNFYESINTKLELYKAINKKPVPLITQYKFDLYHTIAEETGYWSFYDVVLTSQIQRRKLTEFEKGLPKDPNIWTIEQKETHDYAVKSAAEFINTEMSTGEYMKTLREDLNNFKVDINPPLNTKNTSAQMPDAIKLSMWRNFAVKSIG